jgi:hypothetical protein
MGIFDFFKRKEKIVINDAFFGELQFFKLSSPSNGFFSGKGLFNNNEVSYIIHADVSGPDEAQRAFAKNLQANYHLFIEKMIPFIEHEFKEWNNDFKIQDFNEEFKPIVIDIPDTHTTPLMWAITFETIHVPERELNIQFKGLEPDGFSIDK